MCGIIGIIQKDHDVQQSILSSLERLEYRGYDSSGIAIVGNKLNVVKSVGKIKNLIESTNKNPLRGSIGIGHTRWATHGKVTVENAHPHVNGSVAVVHNGIIENYAELKDFLITKNILFYSQTDTEVIPAYINYLITQGQDFENAFKHTISKLQGAYAIAAIYSLEPDTIAVAKLHSPLVIGIGNEFNAIGSDAFSVSHLTKELVYLSDGDYGFVKYNKHIIYDKNHNLANRETTISELQVQDIKLNGYPTFMLKEMHEQTLVLRGIFNKYYDSIGNTITNIKLDNVKRLKIIACGTSHYAGCIGSTFAETYINMPAYNYIASEFRYSNFIVEEGDLYIAISQSGETADTIGAIKEIKNKGGKVLAILNADETTMQHIAHDSVKCHAGIEMGVASTKVFTAQVMTLFATILEIASQKQSLSQDVLANLKNELDSGINIIAKLLLDQEWQNNIAKISEAISQYKSIIYLGRGIGYPVAMEGSLKLKELSYIHSEAMPSGELKHGPIALIEPSRLSICICQDDEIFTKNLSNIESVASRDGKLVLITDHQDNSSFLKIKDQVLGIVTLPKTYKASMPIVFAVAVQFIAYYTALALNNDIDKPRNLAKSVTVE